MSTNPFKFRWLLFLIVIVTTTYGAYLLWGRSSRQTAAAASPAQARNGRGRGGAGVGGRGAAVVTTAARKMDMPVYLRALGDGGRGQHGDRAEPRRRPACPRRVSGRAVRQEGPSSR